MVHLNFTGINSAGVTLENEIQTNLESEDAGSFAEMLKVLILAVSHARKIPDRSIGPKQRLSGFLLPRFSGIPTYSSSLGK